MTQEDYNAASIRRLAQTLVDVRDKKRKEALTGLTSDVKCKVVEEMVNIRLNRLRDDNGNISPAKVSER